MVVENLSQDRPLGEKLFPGGERSRGQAMVELAIMFPILILMLVLIIDFSRIFYHSLVLSNSARDGAWVGTDNTADNPKICAALVASAPSGLALCDSITCPPGGTCTSRLGRIGLPVEVTARYQFAPLTPVVREILTSLGVLPGGTLTLRQSVRMVVL